MCQMSIKLPAMFDQTPTNSFDKIVKNHITKKNTQSLTLSRNVKARFIVEIKTMTWGTENMAPPWQTWQKLT